MELKKAFTLIRVVILMSALAFSCSTDDSVEPAVDPCQANPCASGCTATCPLAGGQVSRDDIIPDGNVVNTDNGYQVDGSLTMDFDSAGTIIFNSADVDVQFDENDRMTGMTGTVEIPSMSNYFTFENPVTADVGYFTGKFLNENRDFEISLKDDIYYFVFNIAVNLELKIGANNDPEATKPLSLKAPEGGNLTLITDFSDPMFFFSVGGSSFESEEKDSNGKDRILAVSFGASFHGNLEYYPTNPTDPVVEFGARVVRGGTFSFWKVLEGKSMLYENADFGVDFNLKEPLESGIKAGYSGGWNGDVGLSLPITSFASFDMPIGEGSTGIVALGNSVTGFTGKAFVKGIVDPDRSWWPDFIPVDWGGNLQASGYVEETGKFDMGLSGEFNLRLATETRGLNGMMRFTNQALTLVGSVSINDEQHEAKVIMNADSTTFLASRPDNFSDGIQETVSQQIDSTFARSEQALADLEKAAEDYEFELSLRGLRATLPELIDRAHAIIDDAVAAGIANGRSQANKILKDNDRALCSDNISSVVNATAKPYRDALNRLKNAVNNDQDTEQTRVELENALRHLASMNKIDKTVQVKIVHGNKAVLFVPKCTQTSTVYRSVKITANILTSSEVAQLNEAADNVKYIQETSDILIDAQRIVDELPSQEELEAMKNRIQECVSELTDNIGESGMTIYHHEEKITYFIMINGERMEATQYDIFNQNDVISVARGKVTACQ